MINRGIVFTYGKKAVTIQTINKEQFYAPLIHIHDSVLNLIPNTLRLEVIFKVNTEIYSGKIKRKKRYYAYDVRLADTIII